MLFAAAARAGVAREAAVAAGFGRVTVGVALPPDADAVATGAATDTVGVDAAWVETFAGEEETVATGVPTETVGVATEAVGVETVAEETDAVATGVATDTVGVATDAVWVEMVADETDAVTTGVATETVGVVSAGDVDTFAVPLPVETVATGVAADTVGVEGLSVGMETVVGVVAAGATWVDDPEPVRDVSVVPRAAPDDPDATRNAPSRPATKQTTRIDRISG